MNCSFCAHAELGAVVAAMTPADTIAAPSSANLRSPIVVPPYNVAGPCGRPCRNPKAYSDGPKSLPPREVLRKDLNHKAPPYDGGGKKWSMREGPEPELFLRNRPQTREPVGLDDQEEHDQGAKDHRFEVRYRGRADLPAEQRAERRQRLVE